MKGRVVKLSKEVREYLAECGRLGGQCTSIAKTVAARKNGKMGGRPKGSKNKKKSLEVK